MKARATVNQAWWKTAKATALWLLASYVTGYVLLLVFSPTTDRHPMACITLPWLLSSIPLTIAYVIKESYERDVHEQQLEADYSAQYAKKDTNV